MAVPAGLQQHSLDSFDLVDSPPGRPYDPPPGRPSLRHQAALSPSPGAPLTPSGIFDCYEPQPAAPEDAAHTPGGKPRTPREPHAAADDSAERAARTMSCTPPWTVGPHRGPPNPIHHASTDADAPSGR